MNVTLGRSHMSSGQGLYGPYEQSHRGSASLLPWDYTMKVHDNYHVQACKLRNNLSCIQLTHGQPLDSGLGVAHHMGSTAAQVCAPHNLTPACLDSLMHPACTMASSAYHHKHCMSFATPSSATLNAVARDCMVSLMQTLM
jgi:hypothetical protein